MLLTPADLAEARVRFDRLRAGSVSRVDWRELCAITLLAEGDVVCGTIVANGLDHFLRVAKDQYDGHAFRRDDLAAIYDRLRTAICRPAGA